MRIYSDITKKFYDNVKACEEAESAFEKEKENTGKRKKELAKAIENADTKLTEANKLYEAAKLRAADILEKSNKEVKEILDTAENEVKTAEQEKLNAVMNFNKEFGTYTTTLTGEKAAEEYNKSLSRFDNIIDSIFKRFWF